MNLQNGEITVGNEYFRPGYTFDDFMRSEFYQGQDSVRVIHLDGVHEIGAHRFVLSLFFRDRILYSVSAVCLDRWFSFTEENMRKALHDSILKEAGLLPCSVFPWGRIESVYDPKGNVSDINIVYQALAK
ncbi:MAG: hypothetical protein II038_09740 [Lachnospiraceae bacterium]|nr:hypothetical protein [Lachnospiraceae bacterium]